MPSPGTSPLCAYLVLGTMGKDKSWLSWLLTEEINHGAHRRISFQAAIWELHYPAPATNIPMHIGCDWAQAPL